MLAVSVDEEDASSHLGVICGLEHVAASTLKLVWCWNDPTLFSSVSIAHEHGARHGNAAHALLIECITTSRGDVAHVSA